MTPRPRPRTLFVAALAALAAMPAVAGRGAAPATTAEMREVAPFEADAPEAAPEPFARVRFADGTLQVVRDDGFEEELAFNGPVYRGDSVRTGERERGEIQLPDGTLVRLDQTTLVEFYRFASPEGEGTNVVGLHRGRIQADVPRRDALRIDSPAASVYVLDETALRVDVEEDDRVTVTVETGRVEVSGEDGSVVLLAGERTRVGPGDAPRNPWPVNLVARDRFGRWVAERDDVYRLHGRPGPEYSALPEEVRPYYPELTRYGQWVWNEEWGWTWVPDVEPDWRPYVRGYWEAGPYGSVWVGYEPWGWPVYRFGAWDFWADYGWVWVPGRVFAPAHVVWYYGPSYVGWCPVGYYGSAAYVGISFGWGDAYFDPYPWVFATYDHVWIHGYRPRYDRYYYTHGHHARDVRHRIIDDGGIVTRHRVRPGDTRHGVSPGNVRRADAPAREHLYERARRLLRAPGSDAREVRELRKAALVRASGERSGRTAAASTGRRGGTVRGTRPVERSSDRSATERRAPASRERLHRTRDRGRPVIDVRRGGRRPESRERRGAPAADRSSPPGRGERPVIDVRRGGRSRPEATRGAPEPRYPARGVERRSAPASERGGRSAARGVESVRRFLGRITGLGRRGSERGGAAAGRRAIAPERGGAGREARGGARSSPPPSPRPERRAAPSKGRTAPRSHGATRSSPPRRAPSAGAKRSAPSRGGKRSAGATRSRGGGRHR